MKLESESQREDESRPLTPPVRVDCYVTDRCNLSCGFCYYKDASRRFLSSGQGDLSGEEWCRFFEELERLQVLQVGLCGGEPLLHADIRRMFDFFAGSRMQFLLYSNGTTVMEEIAKRLAATRRCGYVQISIDGAERAHDRIRGVGVWRKAVRAVELLCQEGVPVHVNMVLTDETAEGMVETARMLVEKYPIERIRVNPVEGDATVSMPAFLRVLRELLPLAEQYPAQFPKIGVLRKWRQVCHPKGVDDGYGCYNQLRKRCAVRSDGSITSCFSNDRDCYGHINRDDFLEAWRREDWQRFRESTRCEGILPTGEKCANCRYRGECRPFCPLNKAQWDTEGGANLCLREIAEGMRDLLPS